MKYKVFLFICSLALGAMLASCAARSAYYDSFNSYIGSRQYTEAGALLERSKGKMYGNKNALLYYLDKGMLYHLGGDCLESNLDFEQAKRIADEYFRKSIVVEATTFLVSDNTRPYYGEDFERALVNVFCALNYVFLGNEEEAIVEARQVDHLLKTLQTDYGHKNIYKEDAFARYLMGMLYENTGNTNDAYISYWQALDAYKKYAENYGVFTPRELVMDAIRTGSKMRFTDEVKELSEAYKVSPGEIGGISPLDGELVVIHYNGTAPEKTDNFFEISFGKAWLYVNSVQPKGDEERDVEQAKAIARGILSEQQIRVAFPKYINSEYTIKNVSISTEYQNIPASDGCVVEDVGAIAQKNLNDRMLRVKARAIARAAIKYALSNKISNSVEEKSKDKVLSWAVKKVLNVASTATETADKRSWRTLPDKILMARMILPKGEHKIKARFLNAEGITVKEQELENIKIQPGRKTIVVVRTVK